MWPQWTRSIHQTQEMRRCRYRRRRPAIGKPSLTTVDNTIPTTVVESDTATGVMSDRFDDLPAERTAESRSRSARIAQADSHLTTVDMSDGEADVRREFSPRSTLNLWVTDDGDLVSQSRIRRIRIAQDVVNSAEKAVYDTLWNTKFEEFQLFTAFSINRTILAHHLRKGHTHVAKIGPGFTYAHPIDDPRRIAINTLSRIPITLRRCVTA